MNCLLVSPLLYFLVLSGFQDQVEGKWRCNKCNVSFKAVGCYKDKQGDDRALKEQILNERDQSSNVYGDHHVDWKNWNNYMAGFVCRCAQAATKRGYSIFGVQYYGECWSGKQAGSFAKHGVSNKCVGDDYKQCAKFSRFCVGKQWTNFVYRIVPTECDVKFERLGCFKDRHIKDARPFPSYMMTDRDKSLKIYSGQTIDWRNWDAYLPEFACRCAKAARAKKHTTFGIQYYGECWSGENAELTYWRDGVSDQCVNKCYKPCKQYEEFCSGKNYANAVYRLSDAPCEIQTKPLGCFAESASGRALGVELVNQRDPGNPRFNGHMLSMDHWPQQFPHFLCYCARAAVAKGLKNFGVYSNATCWGSNNPTAYRRYGKSSKCFQGKQSCPGKTSRCAGGKHSIFAYNIVKTA